MTVRFLMLAAAVLSASVMRGRAADLVELRVHGHYFSEPATVRLLIAVEPDQANRLLRIEADGDRLFRSSQVHLEGSSEKRLHTVEFKNLPAGSYELRAELLAADDVVRAIDTQDLTVFGLGTPER